VSEMTHPQDASGDSPGALLHAERRRQNFSIGDVSRHLKLSVRQVEALERDEYKMFGGPVFVHGFLRNYAKLLGLDAGSLIAAADRKMAVDGKARELQNVQVDEVAQQHPVSDEAQKSVIPVLIAAAVLIAAVGGWMLMREDKPAPEETPASMVAQTESPDLANSEDRAPLTEPGADVPEPPPMRQPTSTASTEGRAISQSSASMDSRSVPVSAVREGPVGVLQFDFFEESWVEITDRYGDVIYSDLNPAGVSRRVSGYPPLTVVIGNANGTVLTYNDKAIDLAPHTRVDVARLTVE